MVGPIEGTFFAASLTWFKSNELGNEGQQLRDSIIKLYVSFLINTVFYGRHKKKYGNINCLDLMKMNYNPHANIVK